MDYILLVVSFITLGFKSVFAKMGNRHLSEEHNIYTYNFYMLLVTFLFMLLVGIPSWKGISTFTVLLAAAYGVVLVLSQVFLIKAMNLGDTSVSTLFYSSGFLVPIVASVFLYDETISLWQEIGVVLMLLSFVVTVNKTDKSATLRWFVLILAALLCNGGLGTIQKIFGMSESLDLRCYAKPQGLADIGCLERSYLNSVI
jgi:drug/metabolite transporter (DMT)-like permease